MSVRREASAASRARASRHRREASRSNNRHPAQNWSSESPVITTAFVAPCGTIGKAYLNCQASGHIADVRSGLPVLVCVCWSENAPWTSKVGRLLATSNSPAVNPAMRTIATFLITSEMPPRLKPNLVISPENVEENRLGRRFLQHTTFSVDRINKPFILRLLQKQSSSGWPSERAANRCLKTV